MKELVKSNYFHGVISTTSRPIREYETAGVNYHFTTDEFISKVKITNSLSTELIVRN